MELILYALQDTLENQGCKVTAATSIAEALENLNSRDASPDILIVDYRLQRNEYGTELIHQVRELYNQTIPALIITGDIAHKDRIERQFCDVKVLLKPILEGDLFLEMKQKLFT